MWKPTVPLYILETVGEQQATPARAQGIPMSSAMGNHGPSPPKFPIGTPPQRAMVPQVY